MKRNIFLILFISLLLLLLLFSTKVEAKKTSKDNLISMGEFKITYYCSCERCSGHWGYQTSTGEYCEEGRTVAVDPDVIAYGTKILIGKKVYIAEDCGSHVSGDHIDIFLEDHDLVEKRGIEYKKIWLIR